MKQFLRPILCGGVLAALLCTPSLAADEGDFSLLVNGKPVTFSDTAPVLKDGRSFLPMAATFEALGFPPTRSFGLLRPGGSPPSSPM